MERISWAAEPFSTPKYYMCAEVTVHCIVN